MPVHRLELHVRPLHCVALLHRWREVQHHRYRRITVHPTQRPRGCATLTDGLLSHHRTALLLRDAWPYRTLDLQLAGHQCLQLSRITHLQVASTISIE